MRLRPFAVLVSCEHGGNRVPSAWRAAFADCEAELASHRGHDVGSLTLARELSAAFDAPLVHASTTRLLVDLNRSEHHPKLWSHLTRGLPPATRTRILEEHYRPYRSRVVAEIDRALRAGRWVLHLSAHSFTPELNGEVRNADVGLLYDPARTVERTLSIAWQRAISASSPAIRVRRNYPYRGTADGLTTALRKRYRADDYAGIEVEVNQRFVLTDTARWRDLRSTVVAALRNVLDRKGE